MCRACASQEKFGCRLAQSVEANSVFPMEEIMTLISRLGICTRGWCFSERIVFVIVEVSLHRMISPNEIRSIAVHLSCSIFNATASRPPWAEAIFHPVSLTLSTAALRRSLTYGFGANAVRMILSESETMTAGIVADCWQLIEPYGKRNSKTCQHEDGFSSVRMKHYKQ